ncbi:MAG: hypothetical protein M8866_06375, partial [marine benthic group bacterium]|nr:hypothetical protein [Candidatus Benthicola marisminoris]
MMNALKAVAIAGVVALSTAACDENPVDPAQQSDDPQFVRGGQPQPELPTIVEIVQTDDGEFDVLETLVVRSGLAGALSGNRP